MYEKIKKSKNLNIPKGRTFSKMFIVSIVGAGVSLICFMLYLVFSYDKKVGVHTNNHKYSSEKAIQEMIALKNKKLSALPNSSNTVQFQDHSYIVKQNIIDSQKEKIIFRDGKLYSIGEDGKPHKYNGKLKKGDIVWKNNKEYFVGSDNKLHPLNQNYIDSGYQPDQFIIKDKKPYILKDNKIVSLLSQGALPGDLVKINDRLYKIDKDGNLNEYHDKFKVGDNVWENGKLSYIGRDNKLHSLKNGQILLGRNNQLYTVKNGHLIAYQKPCFTQKINGKWYISDKSGKLHQFNLGDKCLDNKNIVKFKNNKIIKISRQDNSKSRLNSTKNNQEKLSFLEYKKLLWQSGINANDKVLSANLVSYIAQHKDLQSKNQSKNFLKEQAHGLRAPKSVNSYDTLNAQDQKIAFMKNARKTKDSMLKSGNMNSYRYSLAEGSLIPATLVTGINSDLPGGIIARVSKNVYDSKNQKYLLIPAGTKIIGTYSSRVSYGQSRVLVVWNKLEFANGYEYNLDGMVGVDLSGYSGLSDQVDHHYFKIFGSALLFSMIGAAGQLTQPIRNSNSQSLSTTMYGAVGQQLTQTASNMISKNMNIQPTIKIRPGTNFNILVSRTMVFDKPYKWRFSVG